MDDIMVFAKNKRELETLIQTIRIYSQDIGMEFGIDKWVMLMMNTGKNETAKGIEQPNREEIRTFGEKENYKYLGILEADAIKQTEMKEKIRNSLEEQESS